MWNKWICCLAMLGLLVVGSTLQAGASAATPSTPVAIVTLHGEVNEYTYSLLVRQFTEARRAGAKTIILDIDTYGGMVVSGLDITRFLRSQSDLHIIAYVQKAISAGAMVSVACDEIVMSPSAQIGDCAPIIFDSDDKLHPLLPAERAKEQSPIIDDFDASADHAGYSRLLLESMVVVEKVVYWVEDPKTHDRKFVDQADYDKLTAKGWVSVPGVPCPVDGPDTLLTVHTPEAVQLGLAKGVAPSALSLADQRGHLVADLTPGGGEMIIEFLNHPALRSFLFTILILSLGYIFSAPGHGFAEACAIVSLGLLLGVPLVTGYANWWEVVAIFGGLALLSFEVFVFPGHGVSAVAGIVLILGGLLLTFVGPQPGGGFLPNSSGGWTNLRHGAIALTSSMAISMVVAYCLRSYLPRIPFLNKLILTTTSGNDIMKNSSDVPPENGWPGIGTAGIAVTDLRPGGSAEFLDLSVGTHRPIAVISESGYVTAGSKLIVRESRGNHIVVRPVQA
jgi:membrane-bound serine protease (ClpP class)